MATFCYCCVTKCSDKCRYWKLQWIINLFEFTHFIFIQLYIRQQICSILAGFLKLKVRESFESEFSKKLTKHWPWRSKSRVSFSEISIQSPQIWKTNQLFFLSSHFGLFLEFPNTISSQLLKYRKNKKVNEFLDQKWLFTSLSFKVSLELSLKAEHI